MSLLDWLPWRREKRMLTLAQWSSLGLLEYPSAAGVSVTERTALTLPAYWAGVNLIANAIAKLPRKVYRRMPDGSRQEAEKHPVGWLLQDEPSEYSTPLVFWRTLMAHVLTWGNGYAEIERDGASRPIALLTIPPDRIEPVMEGANLVYVFNSKVRIPKKDILHIPGLGFDGVKGYSVVERARQSLGLALATERYGAAFFGNGAMPGLLLEHPGKISTEASARLKDSWNAMHQGPDRAHRTAVLEEGMKANVLTIPAKDAQLIETRQLQVLEIARLLNLNPTFLGHDVAARPGGNYEASRLDFLDNTLDPWLVAIEQECNRKLLSTQQRGEFYVEHVRNAILRTDAMTRANVQKLYVDMGAMSPEYVAKLENLPKPEPKPEPAPPPAPTADPPADPPEDDPQDPAEDGATAQAQRTLEMYARTARREEDRLAQRAAWRRVAVDVLARMTRLEADRARRASGQGPEKFQAWANEFYPAHEVRLREALEPVVRGWCDVRGRQDWQAPLGEVVRWLVTTNREELLAAKAQALEADVDARASRWETERPSEAAEKILEAA